MATRIWKPVDPLDGRFASALAKGTWEQREGRSVLVPPLVIEWEKGPDLVGDFFWPDFGCEMVVKQHVFRELQERFGGIEAGPVEVIPPKWKRKKRPTPGRGSVTIWSEDLHLVEVQIRHFVDLDRDRSCIKRINENGETRNVIEGAEGIEWRDNPDDVLPIRTRVPRRPGGGIFVKASLLEGHSFFKVYDYPGMNLCTDSVRDFILDKGYTNIDFFELGELF